jgi:hypothetical protein
MKRLKKLLISLFAVCFVFGCASKIPHRVVPEYSKKGTRLIAVMLVKNETSNKKVAQILRGKIINELYFKGYPKIPSDVVDEKLSSVYGKTAYDQEGNVPPGVVGSLLGVDAVFYCTLKQFKTSYVLFYAPTSISITFEMRSAKTGETLWSTQYGMVERCYSFSKKQLEMESYQVYESAIQEVLDKAMETLPDGPDI